MNHPSELLAEYVDGALAERERAVVDAHLGSCETCRREVTDARRAREALRALPRPAAPPGLAGGALAAAAARRAPAARWQRAAGLAAAAVLVLLVAVAVPRFLTGSDDGGSAAEAAGGMAAAAPDLERLDGELDPKDLEAFAEAEDAIGAAAAAAPEDGAALQDRGAEQALRCLGRAYPDIREANAIRVAEATFEGTPAYVGLFERGPGAGQPADTRIALAVASADCSILSFSSASI